MLDVAKTCCLPPPPAAQTFSCSGAKPLDSLTLIWKGTEPIRIKAYKGAVGTTALLADIDNIPVGAKITVTGYAGSPDDVYTEIFKAGTSTKLGTSTFHLSCSDVDMTGSDDCGKAAGDGKALSGYENTWIFDGMAGKGQVLDCSPTPSEEDWQDSCTASERANPSCATNNNVKPTSLREPVLSRCVSAMCSVRPVA